MSVEYQLRLFRKFIGFGITWYDYDGTDGTPVVGYLFTGSWADEVPS